MGTEDREHRDEGFAHDEPDGQAEQEAVPARAVRVPTKPSKQEVDEHMLTHLPYRSWCPHCVRGKSKGRRHVTTVGKTPKEIPTVAVDYMFVNEKNEQEESGGMPTLVIKDVLSPGCGTGMVFAHVVPKKGIQPHAIRKFCQDVGLLGHAELVLKSDGEPAIVALKEAVKRERHERIVLESSPVKESQSNGAIENAIQQLQGQFRAVKDALESRVGQRISGEMSCVPWMMSHASGLINRYHIGEDGKTNYQRWKGKSFKREVAEFGECVFYLKAGTRGVDKFECRWEEGVWLGVRDETGEVIIGTPQGVVKARDFKRRGSLEERWCMQKLSEIKGSPWEPIPGHLEAEIPVKVHFPPEAEAPRPVDPGIERPEIRRRMRIRREDIVRLGYTVGCHGCIAVSRNVPAQNHSEICRERIEKMLREEGNQRLKEADERMAEHLANRMKRAREEDETMENKDPHSGQLQQKRSRGDERTKRKRSKEEQGNEDDSQVHKSRLLTDEEEQRMNAMIDFIDSFVLSVERLEETVYWDDLSGKELTPSLVRAARLEELGEIAKHGVYLKVPIKECWAETGKEPVGTR